MSRHVNLDFQNVALHASVDLKGTDISGNCETRLISRHCHPSSVQDFLSSFTRGSTLFALVKLGNISLVSLLTALLKQLSFFIQASCYSKRVLVCWQW